MQIYKRTKSHTYAGTENRNIKISNSLLECLENPTMLPYADSTWKIDGIDHIMLSTGNSKINALAKTLDTKAVAYGKSTILSCPFASNCVKFCYQNLNNYTASARMHGHNYFMVYTQSIASIAASIQMGIDKMAKKTTIVRLNDNGDFMSLNEILAWIEIATNNPGIVFYGYTKNTPHLYKARIQTGPFPSNFRVSISDLSENDATMEMYMNKINAEFSGEIRTCHIIDTMDRNKQYANLPYNKGDLYAYEYTQDFKIQLHISPVQFQHCSQDEIDCNTLGNQLEQYGLEVC